MSDYTWTKEEFPWLTNGCTCNACVNSPARRNDESLSLSARARFFAVCPDCGNKRCPKGTDHDLACTGSNEPGQKGSQYE